MDKLVEWINKHAEFYPLDKEAEIPTHMAANMYSTRTSECLLI